MEGFNESVVTLWVEEVSKVLLHYGGGGMKGVVTLWVEGV